ncbi:AAA family ATPase [Mongoliitalea lutea]|uniref:Mobilization protein n=1 Tax=Mongoliitalea lutea TaxID=849756 RepID=A0A8J3G6N9_9BACT|nr:AAA family ATPase [Mongoliitalea lutea]GHB45663.1 mobilization protein [Mongoliitalea lutea]
MELNERKVSLPAMDLNEVAKSMNEAIKEPSGTPEPPKPINNKVKVKDWLRMAKIDPKEKIEDSITCLSLVGDTHDGIISTLGNFSLIIGKAKSKKTFSLSLFLSALVANKTLSGKFKGYLPNDKTKVVFFDTEQSRKHVQSFYHRVCRLSSIEEPVNFETFCLRRHTPQERLEIIDFYINSEPDLGFVAIDGIRDLVTSINDEEEATKIASHLLRWTEERNIHIITVLHQNKGDENARGHLGTELVNKAETVLSVSLDRQDRKISIVEPEFCRDREPDVFAFTVNENGLPELVGDWKKPDIKSKKTMAPNEISEDDHKKILKQIFDDLGDEVKGSEVLDRIKTLFEIGDTRAKEFRTYYLSQKWIIRNGRLNSPKTVYTLNS